MHPFIRGASSTVVALGLGALLAACGFLEKSEAPQAVQAAPGSNASDWPATPVSAFRPSSAGACPEGYALAQTTCVHAAYRSRVSAAELETKLAAYRAGAASPRVGGGPVPVELADPTAAGDVQDPSNLPPDAFTKKRLDAAGAKAARLEELETLIRNARIRAGEKVEEPPPVGAGMLDPRDQVAARGREDATKLSEMTAGLPPDVLKAVLVEVQRNGGTALVSLEELQALEAQAKQAEAKRADK